MWWKFELLPCLLQNPIRKWIYFLSSLIRFSKGYVKPIPGWIGPVPFLWCDVNVWQRVSSLRLCESQHLILLFQSVKKKNLLVLRMFGFCFLSIKFQSFSPGLSGYNYVELTLGNPISRVNRTLFHLCDLFLFEEAVLLSEFVSLSIVYFFFPQVILDIFNL